MSDDAIITGRLGAIFVITLNRPHARNAVDTSTTRRLADAFLEFDGDETLRVAVFRSANGAFCASADLKQVSEANLQTPVLAAPLERMDPTAPMGPSYMRPSKPVIARSPAMRSRAGWNSLCSATCSSSRSPRSSASTAGAGACC